MEVERRAGRSGSERAIEKRRGGPDGGRAAAGQDQGRALTAAAAEAAAVLRAGLVCDRGPG